MWSLEDKLNRTLQTKEELKVAINEKGGTITDSTPFSEYPKQIQNLSLGGGGGGVEYTGDYVIIPKTIDQEFPTKSKVMKENLLVTAIPYAQVPNIANGETVTIG